MKEFFLDLYEYFRIKYYSVKGKMKRLLQKIFRGWDDSDLWSLDYSFAKFLYKQLDLVDCWSSDLDKLKASLKGIIFQWDDVDQDFDETEDAYKQFDECFFKCVMAGQLDFCKYELCEWTIKRLDKFIEVNIGYPSLLDVDTDKEGFRLWKDYLFYMKIAFECWNREEYTDKDLNIMEYGFKLFSQYFGSLWD